MRGSAVYKVNWGRKNLTRRNHCGVSSLPFMVRFTIVLFSRNVLVLYFVQENLLCWLSVPILQAIALFPHLIFGVNACAWEIFC